MSNHNLIDIFQRTGMTRAIANPARMARDKTIDGAFDIHGNLRASAVGAAVLLPRDFEIVGTASTGTSIVIPRRMLQTGQAVRLDATARSAPTGGEFTAALYADGAFVGSVSITSGETSGGSNIPGGMTIPAGAMLTWNVTAANGAASVGLTLVYRLG